jgi:predicted RNA-binding Zn ribbon-like protein
VNPHTRHWTPSDADFTRRSRTPSWIASERYGVSPAPGGLALVQDFLNTRASIQQGQDMLGDTPQARRWIASAVQAWSSQRGEDQAPPQLTDHDADQLRDLRDMLDTLISGIPMRPKHVGVAAVNLDVDGMTRWEPIGFGWRWLSSAIWTEVLLSQQASTWQRFKQCRNSACRCTFYDRSWDNSATWHNSATCAQRPGGSATTAGPRPIG